MSLRDPRKRAVKARPESFRVRSPGLPERLAGRVLGGSNSGAQPPGRSSLRVWPAEPSDNQVLPGSGGPPEPGVSDGQRPGAPSILRTLHPHTQPLRLCPSLPLPVSFSPCLSVPLSLSISLSLPVSVSLYISLSVSVSISLSLCLSTIGQTSLDAGCCCGSAMCPGTDFDQGL